MSSLLILGGVIPLAVATVAQFGFGLHPCHFCLLERYPYLVAIICGVGTLLVSRMGLCWRFFVALAILAFLATAVLSVIHTAIEHHWLQFTGGCVAQAPIDSSIEALRAQIAAAPLVACDAATLSFLGLSLASWNALTAFGITAVIFLQYRFERKRLVPLIP